MDIILASAAWVSLAHQAGSFTELVSKSQDFTDLVRATQATVLDTDARWMTSARKHPQSQLVGTPHATILWAIAELYQQYPSAALQQLVPGLVDYLAANAKASNAQNLSNTLWSLGILHSADKEYKDAITKFVSHAEYLTDEFTEQQLANICWGLSCQSHHCYQLCTKVSSRFQRLAFTTPHASTDLILAMTMTASAFATLLFRNDSYMDTVVKQAQPCLGDLPDWNLCAVAWSFAQLYPGPGKTQECKYDGVWKMRGIIKGHCLIWQAGRIANLARAQDGALCLQQVDGTTYTASLSSCGQSLTWSDGDVWEREEQPFAGFCELVRLEVQRRGLTEMINYASLGPGGWYKLQQIHGQPEHL